ncbi:MAG: hypothetical protein MJ246_08505 [Clostridia bacterium]|nr:hypothetical protein [Clostridia bacterium]
MEKDNLLMKSSKKAEILFNYFDYNQVKETLMKKKSKDRFERFRSDDNNERVTVLTIKILNGDILKKDINEERRIRNFGKLLEIVEKNVEKSFGLIYNVDNDLITCVFNTVYEIDNPDYEAIIAALGINIDMIAARKENQALERIKLNMSVVNEDMDFYIRGKRVLLNGEFKLSKFLVDIGGEDSIYIPESIMRKYTQKLDADYLGPFNYETKMKVYKVIKAIDEEEQNPKQIHKESKVKIKKGGEKKLKKYAAEKEQEYEVKRQLKLLAEEEKEKDNEFFNEKELEKFRLMRQLEEENKQSSESEDIKVEEPETGDVTEEEMYQRFFGTPEQVSQIQKEIEKIELEAEMEELEEREVAKFLKKIHYK